MCREMRAGGFWKEEDGGVPASCTSQIRGGLSLKPTFPELRGPTYPFPCAFAGPVLGRQWAGLEGLVAIF